MKYCENPYTTIRRKTHEVRVGKIGIGGNNPIRIQSMTNTNTMDTGATVQQVEKLVEAGCEIVRITAPSGRDAENLNNIKAQLNTRGIYVPLVADIHFTPNAALIAAEYVDKVRVNPGNYAEKGGKKGEFSNTEYLVELERIEEKFRPLVQKCKERNVALRIGTNHGSLSERILSRFGDTPEGMVESAMEFVYFAEAQNFDQIVLSMKASNPLVMIHAYRILVARLYNETRTYPLHLGVTEAGGGVEGRIKSSSGIYSLLQDGLGDTIRVSLTESPVAEIPVAKQIISMFQHPQKLSSEDLIFSGNDTILKEISSPLINPFEWTKKSNDSPFQPLSDEKVMVAYRLKGDSIGDAEIEIQQFETLEEERRPDLIWIDRNQMEITRKKSYNYGWGFACDDRELPDFDFDAYTVDFNSLKQNAGKLPREKNIEIVYDIWGGNQENPQEFLSRLREDIQFIAILSKEYPLLFLGINKNLHIGMIRLFSSLLVEKKLSIPMLLHYNRTAKEEELIIHSAGLLGSLLLDGIGDGLLFETNSYNTKEMDIVFNILQAVRLRITQTEFISCPSCGRTLFDLEETTARIKNETGHLKGLKIGVMGCIVNGPGEMADADFGYVGAGKGKINLYVGHEVVKKNIPTPEATKELIQLIKDHGHWVDP